MDSIRLLNTGRHEGFEKEIDPLLVLLLVVSLEDHAGSIGFRLWVFCGCFLENKKNFWMKSLFFDDTSPIEIVFGRKKMGRSGVGKLYTIILFCGQSEAKPPPWSGNFTETGPKFSKSSFFNCHLKFSSNLLTKRYASTRSSHLQYFNNLFVV